MSLPLLSSEQIQQARSAALVARQRRAEVKRQVTGGEIVWHEVIESAGNDAVIAQMRVVDLLRAIPRIGKKRADKLMGEYKISATRRLRGLGPQQLAGLRTGLQKIFMEGNGN